MSLTVSDIPKHLLAFISSFIIVFYIVKLPITFYIIEIWTKLDERSEAFPDKLNLELCISNDIPWYADKNAI